MAELSVIVPSKGRPEKAHTLARIFRDSCTSDTELIFAVDSDDPMCAQYYETRERIIEQPTGTMVSALNKVARLLTQDDQELPVAVGFMGDDHVPRTHGWDTLYLDTLREMKTGMVYGDDLLQSHRLPTQITMTPDIIRVLGFMAPPVLTHLYVDNFWMSLGVESGCIRYLPDVVIEHRHPIAGKSHWDEGYRRVNSQNMYIKDADAFKAYIDSDFLKDLEAVKALRGRTPVI